MIKTNFILYSGLNEKHIFFLKYESTLKVTTTEETRLIKGSDIVTLTLI